MARKKAEAVLNGSFFKVPKDILASGIFKSCHQMIVYVCLKYFADENGECFPTIKQLVKLSKVGTSKVKYTLKELAQLGIIKIIHRTRPNGRSDSNLYVINDSPEVWGAESKPGKERPFILVYRDFLQDDQLDSCYQKLVYICLGKFTNNEQQCFPSLKRIAELAKICVSKVKTTINELREKGLIEKKNRFAGDGSKISNLYTLLYNIKIKSNIGKDKIRDGGIDSYKFGQKKALDSTPTKATNQALCPQNYNYTITNPENCQVKSSEKYSMDFIHEHYGYEAMVIDHPDQIEKINAAMFVIYDTLNTKQPTVRVGGDDKPSQVVVSQFLKLDMWSIMYAIEQFNNQNAQEIKYPKSYMRSILYNLATGGYELGIQNQMAYNRAHWDGDPGLVLE